MPRFGKHDGYLASSRQRYNDRFFDLTSHEMIGRSKIPRLIGLTVLLLRGINFVMPFLNCGDLDERKQIKRNLF